jgi:hypothetical protein
VRPHEAAYTAMLLPTIKPVYSGTYATGSLKIQEKCMVQAHKVQETMQGTVKLTVCSVIHHSMKIFGDTAVEAHVFLMWAEV